MSLAFGLFVVIAIPLTVLAICVLWPDEPPKDRTVGAIRDRIERDEG
ncbi:hypothetical protein [Nocardia wallacei]|nr:hypothetical protein [Nocardia wallacei]